MVTTTPAPEISRGPVAETLLVQATETCRIVTPVQPEAASHTILLSVWRRIVLDADGSPAMVREHGNVETHSSTARPEGQSPSPVSWTMSLSYTRESHAAEKPEVGQSTTCDVTYTKNSAEGPGKSKQHAQCPCRDQSRHPRAAARAQQQRAEQSLTRYLT